MSKRCVIGRDSMDKHWSTLTLALSRQETFA